MLISDYFSRTFEQYSHLSSLDGVTPWSYVGNFLSVSFGSTAIGVIIALLCSFLFRRSDFSETPPYEFTLTLLFAYASYCLSEIIGMYFLTEPLLKTDVFYN